jgi:Acetyltransferase (GNAT) domain
MGLGLLERAWKPRLPLSLILPLPAETLNSEIQRLAPEQFLLEQGPFVVLLARPSQIPALLLEVGRLREVTFRLVGEGTGAAFDLDTFDQHYDQLILWNREHREVVGAYRLAPADQTLQRHGPAGLYTASLFRLSARFFHELGPAIELGRSFIRPEYQRKPQSLFMLWRGIGRYLDRYPSHRILFGPVSISARYSSEARSAMATYFDHCNGDEHLRRHVQPKRRFRLIGHRTPIERALTLEDLDRIVRSSGVEPDSRGIPVLLRHYLNLGGRVLSVSVDPSFGSCLDALIVVDLRLPGSKLLDRVFGLQSVLPSALHRLPSSN